ncbi:MAG TPA: bifunctional phosphoribosylaminoimidazolecarboxamide formyltransferase/IMP cyclohydrolase, partial [Candidatus Marinimicrobia bacterium]|nr:bifunctional phosphoribosylaminoimidazolecarboxamide formyltransferase/IMP cyclohydrolase [Candidatus Neomarinimicrobiota bacterium]
VQDVDTKIISRDDLTVVTDKQPTDEEIETALFTWKVLRHAKSNSILIGKSNTSVGLGAGQVSRVDAVNMALRKGGEKVKGGVLASDAFFPFRDSIDAIRNTGISTVIQPGGSIRDQEVIDACNDYGIAMVFTGIRCFKH